MAPNFDLEESEERALRNLDRTIRPEDLVEEPEGLEDLAINLEGSDDSIDPNLPENFIEVVQARAIRGRRNVTPEVTYPETNIDEFIAEKSESFHMSRITITPDPDVVEELADSVDDEDVIEGEFIEIPEEEEPTEKVQEQEELQAAHISEPKFTFQRLEGKYYARK